MNFDDHVGRALSDLERAGLLRTPRTVGSIQGPVVTLDGREVILLCSNNYLGLADHPALAASYERSSREWGSSGTASRLISGTMPPHRSAEIAAAAYVGADAAVLFSSGYAANVGTLQGLLGPDDVVFSDALNHASLIDGCRLSRATVHVYRHADPEHLSQLLETHRRRHRAALVVSDGLFSMDGDLAPVGALRGLCDRFDAGLFVDEAHSIGTLGPQGRGLCAAEGVRADVLVGTLGKAFALAGAFAAGSAPLARLLENRARSFVFSTALPPAVAGCVPTAIELVRGADDRRAQAARHAARLRAGLRSLGLEVGDGGSAIIPVLLHDDARTMRFSQRLLELGLFAHGIRPPTVPRGTSRLRVVPMATHTDAHIDRALEMFATAAREIL